MVTERPRKKEKRYLNCTPSKPRPREPILLLLVFNSVQLWQVFLYRNIFWFKWMAQRLFFRLVFIFNFLNINYFSFSGYMVLVLPHFWCKEYFSRTPGSYKYTNSIGLVPRFGLWPSPRSISKKSSLCWMDSLVPIHQLPVPGGKLWMCTTQTFLVYQNIIFELVVSSQPWCDPLFKTRGVTHCFLQHLLVRPIVFPNTSKTRLIKWKQGPGIQCWISKLCFLRPVLTERYWNWFSKAGTLCQKVTFRGYSVRSK